MTYLVQTFNGLNKTFGDGISLDKEVNENTRGIFFAKNNIEAIAM